MVLSLFMRGSNVEMKYVERIAKVGRDERITAIKSILEENGISYLVQKEKVGEHEIENIIVSLNPTDRRLVIGAHWDSVEGSSGANDNASGCSVVLHLIEVLRNTDKSIDFVFFDREECEDHGSTGYIQATGAEKIAAMINLDIVGTGKRIVVSDKGNVDNAAFLGAMNKENIDKHEVTTVLFLPNGDDDRFVEANIPNISVCTIEDSDLDFFIYLGEKLGMGKPLDQEDEERFMKLDILSTMHLGENDNIFCLKQESIDMVANWLADGLK